MVRWMSFVHATTLCLVGCGPGVGVKYEGDVRFERCMALDWHHDLDPTIRRACWIEWSTYFTAGQTRDRIEYAATQAGLSKADPAAPLRVVPQPTNVFAPPPMMLADAGVDTTDGGVPIVDHCNDECVVRRESCLENCGQASKCQRACSLPYTRCLEKCR